MKKSVIILFGVALFASLLFANSTIERLKTFIVETKLVTRVDLTQLSFKMKYNPTLFSVKESNIVKISNIDPIFKNNILISIDNDLGQIVWSIQDYFGAAVIKSGNISLLSVKFTALSSSRKAPLVTIENLSAFDTTLNNVKFLIFDKRPTIVLRQLP